MKPIPLLLALSLAANAALAVVLLRHTAGGRAQAVATAAPAAVSTLSPEAAARAQAAEAIASAAKSGDAVALRDRLRALGLPEDVIRAAVRAVIYRPFAELQKKFRGQAGDAPYWRPDMGYFGLSKMTKEQRIQMRQANGEVIRKMEELVGPDPDDPMVRRYSFLPEEKASKLRALERDYNELRSQLYNEQEGFRVPGDQEKLAYLEKEQRKDIESLLSPEELQAYDLRSSAAASSVRGALRGFDVTENEYKALYAAVQALDAPVGDGAEQAGARRDAQQQLQQQLRTILGEERYKEYLRSQNYDYRTLDAAAKRFDLPQTTVDQVASAREQALTTVQQISQDSSLTPEQRRAALARLAEQTRSQVKTALGPEVGDAYLKSSMRWLDMVQRGMPVMVAPDGNVRPVPQPGPSRPPSPVSLSPEG